MLRPGSLDVGRHLLVDRPGDPRPGRPGLELARMEVVVAEERDAEAVAIEDERQSGLTAVAAATEAPDAGLVEQRELLEEGVVAKIAGVIVGQRHDPEVPADNVEDAGVGPERVGLVDRFANCCHNAFEIRDCHVDPIENIGKLGEGVPARCDRLPGEVGEHDIAGEGERHLVGRVARQGN